MWALDIEAQDWTRFVLAAAVSADGREHVFRSPAAVARWYASTGSGDTVLAHNGGRYDFLALLDACGAGARWTGRLAGSAIVSMRAPGHAECRDTYRVVPFALRRWADKLSLGLPCECGSDCGGYCAIRQRGMTPAARAQLAAYCVQDCRALLAAWRNALQWLAARGFDVFGRDGRPRRTMGGIAWATVRAVIGPEPALERGRYLSERAAYYGGRAEVGRVRAAEGGRYDIRSAYPWALTCDVPDGAPARHGRAAAARALAAQRPGLYHVTVNAGSPGDSWATVPHRSPRGALLWATGRVTGWYALPELAHATIDAVHGALVYPRAYPRYAPALRAMWEVRDACEASDWRRGWVKLLANSVSGKLAQRPDGAALLVDDDAPPGAVLVGGRRWLIRESRIADCARPAVAAYLTARVRAERVGPALRAAGTMALYTDTDSCYVAAGGTAPATGDGLGSWSFEGALHEWRARGPKAYAYRDDSGALRARVKGVPGDPAALVGYLDGAPVTLARLAGYRARGDGRAWRRVVMTRALRYPAELAGTRHVLPGGATVPLHRATDGAYHWPGVDTSPVAIAALRGRLA